MQGALGGAARIPTDSKPFPDSVISGTCWTSQVLGTAMAEPPGVESPVFLSPLIREKPGREKSSPPCSLVSLIIMITSV